SRYSGSQVAEEYVGSIVGVVWHQIIRCTFKDYELTVGTDRRGLRRAIAAAGAGSVDAHQHRFAKLAVPRKHVERAIAIVGDEIVRRADKNDEPTIGTDAGVVAISRSAG